MITAIDALLRRWKEKESKLLVDREAPGIGDLGREFRLTEIETLSLCARELRDTVTSVKPAPLTEASNAKLYKWAGRMVQIMDLMTEAQGLDGPQPYDPEPLASIAEQIGKLATRDFLNDVYDLFKQLANRQSGA